MAKTKPIRHGDARDVLDAFGGEFKFRVFTGAWRLRPTPNGILFNLPAGAWCAIVTTAPGLYSIEIGYRDEVTTVGETHDVTADKLAATFTAMTGINTTL